MSTPEGAELGGKRISPATRSSASDHPQITGLRESPKGHCPGRSPLFPDPLSPRSLFCRAPQPWGPHGQVSLRAVGGRQTWKSQQVTDQAL